MSGGSRYILGLETSGRTGSTALADGQGHILASRQLGSPMRHAAEIVPMIQAMLGERGLPGDAITDVFVSIGPGSFTGLRIAVSIARTLAWASDARIVAVPTLECLARNGLLLSPPPPFLATILDAKRQQVFAALFAWKNGTFQTIKPAHLVGTAAFLAGCPRPLAVLGEGIPSHRQVLMDAGVDIVDESLWAARADQAVALGLPLADAGQYIPAGSLIPHYIRRPEPEERWEQRQPNK